MSTSGSYTPAAVPECLYAPRMTRAAALALRAAGGLKENCVVIVTDGPVIGCAGNTSPTEIELQPTGPNSLGLAALVHPTAFDNSGWIAVYDIDLGTAGSITELTDDFGNHVKDEDADSPNVHSDFPWHLRGPDLRDNYSEDTTGWCTYTAGVAVDNTTRQATLDFAAFTTGDTFRENTVVDRFDLAFTGAGSVKTVTGNRMTGDTDADNTVTDLLVSATAGTVTLDGNEFFNDSSATAWTFGGTGASAVRQGTLRSSVADQIFRDAPSTFTSQRSDFLNGKWKDIGGAGSTAFNHSRLSNVAVFRDAGATGGLNLNRCDLSGSAATDGFALLRQEAASTSAVALTDLIVAADYRMSFANTDTVTMTASVFRDGSIAVLNAVFTNSGTVTIDNSDFRGSDLAPAMPQLDIAGSGAVTIETSEINQGKITTLAAQTVPLAFTNSKIVGYKIRSAQTAGSGFSSTESEFIGLTAGPNPDMDVLGTGQVLLRHDRIVNDLGTLTPQFLLDGSGGWTMTDCTVINSVDLATPPMQKTAASTGVVNIFGGAQLLDSTLHVTSTGGVNGSGGNNVNGSGIQHNGAGLLTLVGLLADQSTITMGAASTRGLTLASVVANGSTFSQAGTGNANTDSLQTGSTFSRASVNLNNTAVGQASDTYQGLTMLSGATLNVQDPGGATNPVNNTLLDTQAVLNIQPGGTASRVRLSNEAVLNTGAFSNLGSIIEGQFTKTSTGANVNRLCSKAFDDWI